MKTQIIEGQTLVDISKKKLQRVMDRLMTEGIEASLDKILKEMNILIFLDCSGKHTSRYLEIRRG